MGDTIEITTRPYQPITYYEVNSCVLSFEVKGTGTAVIGLTTSPDAKCKYWFLINSNGRITIHTPLGLNTDTNNSFRISRDSYQKFWIRWDSAHLQIGHDTDSSPILSCEITQANLRFVTFTSKEASVITWKVTIPPIFLKSPPVKSLPPGGEPHWVSFTGVLPEDAVIGGFEGETLYVIRAAFRQSLTPGKYVHSTKRAYIPWGGRAVALTTFEMLCGYNFVWVPTTGGKIPNDAFVAGQSERNDDKLYIGRVYHENSIIPGKVHDTHKVCYAAIDGSEVAFKSYEILTVPNSNPHAAGSYMDIDINWDDIGIDPENRANQDEYNDFEEEDEEYPLNYE